MSEKKHTPGPWTLEPYGDGSTDEWEIAPIDSAGFADWSREVAIVVSNAHDAHLIAAAPDLLITLKDCREAIAAAMRVIHGIDLANRLGLAADNYEQRLVDEIKAVGVTDGFGVRAEAAIAKAEGR